MKSPVRSRTGSVSPYSPYAVSVLSSDSPHELQDEAFWWDALADTEPRWKRLADACRAAGLEVMYTVIQSLTRLDHARVSLLGLRYDIQ